MNLHSSVLRFAHRLFLWLGIAILVYAGGTAAYAVVYQRYQSREFQRALVTATRRHPEHHFSAARVVKSFIAEEVSDLREGDVVGKLEVPRIGISVIVLQGIENDTLSVGAGHVPGTPLPGADGNVAIAAHRDTFFRKLEGIVAGDSIQFANVRGGTYQYLVDSTETVDPEDTRVMESREHPELTLITCYPFYFVGAAPKRFIVHAHPSIDKRLNGS
jgi:LPXTG-site transpeptidase (sortase) family protein